MGVFSFLKKKPSAPVAADDPRLAPASTLHLENERARQRDIARATAAKIDAIELAMTTDFFDTHETQWGSTRRAPAAASLPVDVPAHQVATPQAEPPAPAAAPASAPVVDESAILYANGQLALAEQMLRASLPELGQHERAPWWMLFDLYQSSARERDFDSIAIDYASHFDTSPPSYVDRSPVARANRGYAGAAPIVRLVGVLDGTTGARFSALPPINNAPLQIDFSGIHGASADGCASLLTVLQSLRTGGCELVLTGTDKLLMVLRPMLAIGERGAGPAPWLLLIELLQLLQREKDFEETAMDYCVTFEVSPPSFEPGSATPELATALLTEQAATPILEQRFVLPALIDTDMSALLAALEAYAASAGDTLVLDCAHLVRIDFSAATSLHSCLQRLSSAGHQIEFQQVNHLVAALLRLLNIDDCARLYPHPY